MARGYSLNYMTMDYKSKTVEAIMETLLGSMQEFSDRRKMGQWKGIIFALGEVYPEDRAQMIKNAFPEQKPESRKTKAKITRSKPATAAGSGKPCADCPGATFGRTGTAAGSNTPAPRVARKGKAKEEEPPRWETVEDVVTAFEGSAEAMTAYCQAKQIKLPGNIKDVGKIANYILQSQ